VVTEREKVEIPELIPDPREVCRCEGVASLSTSVSLSSGGLERADEEALASVLASAGISLTQNGGGTAIAVRVGASADLKLGDVPEPARGEYYELELRGADVAIRALERAGAIWGTHTLVDLFRAQGNGADLPNLAIRDWPDLPNRGIFVESKWGPDRMTPADWKVTIDRLAGLKMNRMGIGLYGCWGNCRYEGPNRPTEFLMAPVPGHPELKTEKRLKWFSPKSDAWKDETYLPRIFECDFLGEVVAYGRERGVTVVPFVNSLGHNTFIPRLVPEVSAKSEDGTPRGVGYCLSSPETRELIEGFYASVIERYFPGGADFFHIQLDEVWPDYSDPEDPERRADPWCECPECRSREREENLQAYILWLVKMLVDRGARKVVMWNDQLTRHMDALDGGFVGKLRDAGLADRLILHWWWYNNEELNDRTRVSIGRELGLPGWVGPMTCYFNWERYSPRLRNIDLMMQMAHDEDGEGAVSYAVHDPGWTDHEMLLASHGWNHAAVGSAGEQVEKWALGRYRDDADGFVQALERLQQAAESPALTRCYYYTYTYVRPNVPFPRAYPEDALTGLAGLDGAQKQLGDVALAAAKAREAFATMVGKGKGDERDRACVCSLLGEAARMEALAGTFAYLLEAHQQVGAGRVSEATRTSGQACRKALLGAMETMEEHKPSWVAPACLQAMSVLLAFLDQLEGDLTEAEAGARASGAVRWKLADWEGAG